MQWRQYVNPFDVIWRLDNLGLNDLEVKDLVLSYMNEPRECPVTEIFLNHNLIGIFTCVRPLVQFAFVKLEV